jgi:hypothetical protein
MRKSPQRRLGLTGARFRLEHEEVRVWARHLVLDGRGGPKPKASVKLIERSPSEARLSAA